ncbi:MULTISPECIES: Lrp/AsnC family transcriptional regulator [Tenacibaculum]|uniref:Lrp/AsnC family transcriptional regulator n=1 Tax=Tenacibaculum TaxID=104267 RepID=UPI000898A255|nr:MULTISPECIES: Lrp/AsnC family transcriptional regulator [unclassified Tenacibaculum]RBW57011.1 Lrp/AsnC family transcriptional regulator [Tenacibaculum sp. E3R01]SED43278.1 Lrp/AsnC family transcriptional regulator, leucine-responsive regulatory protein [Tenacibaculum sp. MAR_2010_89]
MIHLDPIDLKIIEELQKDGKQSIKQLSQKINLSITPTHERIKKIEASGIIEKYVAIVNPELLGKNLIVYCQVTLVQHEDNAFKKFEDYVNSISKILEVSYIAGSFDILLKIILKDMNEYQNFVLKEMSQLEIISNIQSSFVIKQIKNDTLISVI